MRNAGNDLTRCSHGIVVPIRTFLPRCCKGAWDHGEAWLDSCLAYIQKNDQFVREFAEDTWNGDVKISPLEGTYLQWIDFRRLEPDAEKLRQKMLYQAHVAMDEGSMFGPEEMDLND